MNIETVFITTILGVTLTACTTTPTTSNSPTVLEQHKNISAEPSTKLTSRVDSAVLKKLIAQQEVKYMLHDEHSVTNIPGKISLYKIKNGCELNNSFIYSKSEIVTYRYTFKSNQLISANSAHPNEYDPTKTIETWDDPSDDRIIELFNQAKDYFSSQDLLKCN